MSVMTLGGGCVIDPGELIASSRKLLDGKPSEADMRRAVSAAYCALFHHRSMHFSAILIRPAPTAFTRAWLPVYRYPDHGPAKQRCMETAKHGFPVAFVRYALIFADLQQRRIDADYNPVLAVTQQDAEAAISTSEQTMALFDAERPDHQRAFVLFLCLRPKSR